LQPCDTNTIGQTSVLCYSESVTCIVYFVVFCLTVCQLLVILGFAEYHSPSYYAYALGFLWCSASFVSGKNSSRR